MATPLVNATLPDAASTRAPKGMASRTAPPARRAQRNGGDAGHGVGDHALDGVGVHPPIAFEIGKLRGGERVSEPDRPIRTVCRSCAGAVKSVLLLLGDLPGPARKMVERKASAAPPSTQRRRVASKDFLRLLTGSALQRL
jgi:hypothetical protein